MSRNGGDGECDVALIFNLERSGCGLLAAICGGCRSAAPEANPSVKVFGDSINAYLLAG